MMPFRNWHRLPLLTLALLLAPLSARAAERSAILLYGFTSSSPATPQAIAPMVAVLVREELEKGGKYLVQIRNADDPEMLRAESQQPTVDPTRLHQALRV